VLFAINEMSRDYKVNRLLWETLEATLLAHGKRFVKDMAETLQVDEKVLIRHVFPSKEAFKVSIQDTDATGCMAFKSGSPSLALRCRRPVQTGTAFCPQHTVRRPVVSSESVAVRKLQDAADRPALWLLPDQSVIDSEGTVRGSIVNDRLILIA
jgi:hypothetical protein